MYRDKMGVEVVTVNRALRQAGIAAVCLLAFGACGSSHGSATTASSLVTNTTPPATTLPPETPTSGSLGSAPTTRPTAPPLTQQVVYSGVQVTVTYSPSSGRPGARVGVTGSGFVGQAGQIAQNDAYRFNLQIELPGCELIAQPSNATGTVSSSGALSGSFTVPSTGECFQQSVDKPLSPGQYTVLLGAHTASLGIFTITGG